MIGYTLPSNLLAITKQDATSHRCKEAIGDSISFAGGSLSSYPSLSSLQAWKENMFSSLCGGGPLDNIMRGKSLREPESDAKAPIHTQASPKQDSLFVQSPTISSPVDHGRVSGHSRRSSWDRRDTTGPGTRPTTRRGIWGGRGWVANFRRRMVLILVHPMLLSPEAFRLRFDVGCTSKTSVNASCPEVAPLECNPIRVQIQPRRSSNVDKILHGYGKQLLVGIYSFIRGSRWRILSIHSTTHFWEHKLQVSQESGHPNC